MFKKKRHYPPKRPANYRPDFKRYEFEKTVWAAAHPRATSEEYSQAMRSIAKMCGI